MTAEAPVAEAAQEPPPVELDRAKARAEAIEALTRPEGSDREEEPAEEPVAEEPDEPEAPKVVVVRVSEPEAEAPPEPPPAAMGSMTISAVPRAQVLVDGQFIRYTPLFKHEIPAGAHTVELIADDGRTKSFRVDVTGGVEARRVWLFNEEQWAE